MYKLLVLPFRAGAAWVWPPHRATSTSCSTWCPVVPTSTQTKRGMRTCGEALLEWRERWPWRRREVRIG